MSRPGAAQHYSGSADTTGVVIPLVRKLGQRINIRNLDGTNKLNVALTPSGKVYYTIPANSFLDFDCVFQQFWVQGNGGTVAWCAVTVEG